MVYTLSEIHTYMQQDRAAYVRRCDAAYEDSIRQAADGICQNMKESPVVLLAGPSGSGKTTTANKLAEELLRRGVGTHVVSIDNYFKTLDYATVPRTEDGKADLESPECVDTDLLNKHFSMLNRGEEIRIPYFDFTEQRRSDTRFTEMKLQKDEVAVFEGIHALNDSITDKHPEAYNLYVSVQTEVGLPDGKGRFYAPWIRLMRRIVRDSNFRGVDAAWTLDHWTTVLEGERKYIEPFREKADLQLDSFLGYEISVLKEIILPQLHGLPVSCARREEVNAILSALNCFAGMDAENVPRDSLLREFIGGGIYTY